MKEIKLTIAFNWRILENIENELDEQELIEKLINHVGIKRTEAAKLSKVEIISIDVCESGLH